MFLREWFKDYPVRFSVFALVCLFSLCAHAYIVYAVWRGNPHPSIGECFWCALGLFILAETTLLWATAYRPPPDNRS